MDQKTEITADKIIELYMNEVLLGEVNLSSVYAFAIHYEFEESQFYTHFSSFEVLEKRIFEVFCTNTMLLLAQNEAYQTYDAKSKLLSFYYTFFELLTANRSYVFKKLKGNKNKLESLKLLSKLRMAFIAYISNEIHTEALIDFKNERANKLQDKSFSEAAWIHLLFTLQFWLEDESESFEKTDVFIEKSVNLSFELKDLAPIKSVFDFAKFLWKEKMPKV